MIYFSQACEQEPALPDEDVMIKDEGYQSQRQRGAR